MSHPNSSSNMHKNGDICWVAVLRDTVVLVETTGNKGEVDGGTDGKDGNLSGHGSSSSGRPAALEVAIGELLGQPVNLGWQFYSPWQKEYKGIKFHIYDDSDSGSHDANDDSEVTVWTFACIYYTGVVVPLAATTGAEVGSTCTSSTSVVHRPRLQAFLEKIMLLTEPLRQADGMWRKGEQYACQEIYADMIWQRLQEEQLEYQQYHGHVVNAATAAADHLDYTRKLTENNRQVVNRHNQVLAERDERKRCQELALLQQMQELNQRLEREQQQSHSNNNSSKKGWWSSSSTSQAQSTNVTSSSSVAQQLLAAASRQIFPTSSSSQSQASSSSSSINSVETVENNKNDEQQQQQNPPLSQQGLLLHMNDERNHLHHHRRNSYEDDDDVHSVESINAMSDVSSVCVEDILSQLEREVTYRNHPAVVHDAHDVVQQQPNQQEPKTPPSTPMREHVYHPEEEKKEMEHDDANDWNEPQQSSQSDSNKSLHSHHQHGGAPKSPSSTMADVVLGE